MNVWNAPIVTSGNKPIHVIPEKAGIQKRVCASHDSYARYRSRWIPAFAGMTYLFTLLIAPHIAKAQESAAQGLYGVKEILVRPVRFEDPALAKSCRLDHEDLDALIMSELKDNGLPAIAEANSPPSTGDVARIILVPQIVPYNSQGLDCVTWVALSAESRNHLRVLPIEIPRVVNVIYWRNGELVASAVSVHADHVTTSLQHMIKQFGARYTAAQPPTIGHTKTPAPR